MTVDDIKRHYGLKTNSEVAEKLKVSRVAVGKWARDGIPELRQAAIQLLTNNALTAELKSINT